VEGGVREAGVDRVAALLEERAKRGLRRTMRLVRACKRSYQESSTRVFCGDLFFWVTVDRFGRSLDTPWNTPLHVYGFNILDFRSIDRS
jgi:hypothetical protein